MALPNEAVRPPKQTITFESSDTLSEAFGGFGLWVGPRTGPNRRTQAHKEAYVARRAFVAMVRYGYQPVPFTLEVSADDWSVPDFVIDCEENRRGLEITEAGDPSYQEWLTNSESISDPADGDLISVSIAETVDEWCRVLQKKQEKLKNGAYASVPACDLAIYDNTKGGSFLDLADLVREFRNRTQKTTGFKSVHIVKDLTVCLDALGEGNRAAEICSLAGVYEVDYLGWIDRQVRSLRANDVEVDAVHIAEELSDLGKSEYHALRSQLKRLTAHLLKWRYQPSHRSSGWASTIDDARDKIGEIVAASPSMKPRIKSVYEDAYKSARRQAALEMGMDDVSALPAEPEFGLNEVLDPDFFPDAEDDGSSQSESAQT